MTGENTKLTLPTKDKIAAQRASYGFPILEVKRIVSALIACRLSYKEIASVIDVKDSAIKQFVRRTGKARKTPLYSKLLKLIAALPSATIDAICETEPTLRQTFLLSEVSAPPFPSTTARSDFSSAPIEAISTVFGHVELYPNYMAVLINVSNWPPEGGIEVEKTRIHLKYNAGRLEYIEEERFMDQDRSKSRWTHGIISMADGSLCLVSPFAADRGSLAVERKLTWAMIPDIGLELDKKESKLKRIVVPASTNRGPELLQQDKYSYFFGTRITQDGGKHDVQRVMLLAPPITKEEDIGKVEYRHLSNEIKGYLKTQFMRD